MSRKYRGFFFVLALNVCVCVRVIVAFDECSRLVSLAIDERVRFGPTNWSVTLLFVFSNLPFTRLVLLPIHVHVCLMSVRYSRSIESIMEYTNPFLPFLSCLPPSCTNFATPKKHTKYVGILWPFFFNALFATLVFTLLPILSSVCVHIVRGVYCDGKHLFASVVSYFWFNYCS